MPHYSGQVPFPLPDSTGVELRENVPFKSTLKLLRRAGTTRHGFLVDSECRCFQIFYRDFSCLETAVGHKLEKYENIIGVWEFHRQGVAFGIYCISYRRAGKRRYHPVPVYRKRVLNPSPRPFKKVSLP